MKILLRIVVVFMFASFSFHSFAQLRFGAKVGVNFAKIRAVYDGDNDNDVKALTSFAIGGTADYALSDALSIQPSLLFSGKGFKYKEDDYKFLMKLYYLELPINVVYKYDIGVLKIYGAAGPYFGFAIGGTWDDDGDKDKIKFGDGNNDDNIKRGDFGLNIGAGVEVNSFQIGLNYG